MQRLLAIIFGAALAALTLGVAIAGETVELVSVWNPTGALPDGCTPGLTGGGGPAKWVIVDSEPDGPHAAIYRAIGAKVRDQLQDVIAAA